MNTSSEVPRKVRQSIRKVVEYLYRNERRHFECGREDNHIFLDVMRVAEHFFPGEFAPAEDENEEKVCV